MRIKLKSLKVTETVANAVDIEFNHLAIGDFNLLISDNAQGKTRLLRTLNFLSRFYKDKRQMIRRHAIIIIKIFLIGHFQPKTASRGLETIF